MDGRYQDRRLQRTPLYFPERRSGFDRRTPGGLRGRYNAALLSYRENESAFLLVLATIVVFNYMDYHLTLRVLEAGGSELNPIMARLFGIGPEAAAAAKLGSVGAVSLILLALRRYRRTLEASLFLLVAYSVLMFYHVALALRLPN
jgi:hypothetical protein